MAKQIRMVVLHGCPHCKRAAEMISELEREHPEYARVSIEVIEETEEPEKIKEYDFYYVPAFFVDGKKIHEGVPTIGIIEKVFEAALE